MSQKNRLEGGLIDRSSSLNFTFDGASFEGYQGDTLASALLANGQRLVGRSFKYHRPRGIFTAGSEEPNALMEINRNGHIEPNTRATTVELYEGLKVKSQNRRGSLKYDFMAINDAFSPFLAAGFYYKTFMWPKAFWEKVYEPIIRNSAGLGSLNMQHDPELYDHGYLHCDILVIGAGAAGLQAALTSGRAGARVIIADEDSLLGGRMNAETTLVNDARASDWATTITDELHSMPNVRIMMRSTVQGAYNQGCYSLVERVSDHRATSDGKPRQIAWRVYSKRAILAAGATERPIAFHNNDRPGIMLAGAVRAYANRWATQVGDGTAIFTNNDDGWRTARDLIAKGSKVSAVIDVRDNIPAIDLGGEVPVFTKTAIVDTSGRHGVNTITLSNGEKIATECVAVSGGWSPNVHLTCHQGGRPKWNDDLAAFIPGDKLPEGMSVVGAASGAFSMQSCFETGDSAARVALKELGFSPSKAELAQATEESMNIEAYWYVKDAAKRAWIDFQNDVTVKDVKLAHLEGFSAVEHLKRYTTMGMATDQGKTANVIALAAMADCTGKSIAETGTTIFRPPYTPVAIGAYAGRARGQHYRPTRITPSHQWALENGGSFTESGAWMRAEWYVRPGEKGWRDSVDREAAAVRTSVGVCDVSTLGKIDIKGTDATDFINRVYANAFAKLAVGKVRYGIMLREDGILMDDGTTARLSDNHYLMTTTTANAVRVFRHLEFCRQCLWPDMDVHLISTTDQYAQYAVAGPNSRNTLQKLVDQDISNEAFPFMACADITVCGGVPARLFRISFSGELAYEIAIPLRYGRSMIEAIMQAGEEYNITPYGLEALNVLRIEKGHATVNELNGQTTAAQLGMGSMVSTKKDSIGAVLSRREGLARDDDYRLVGVIPVDTSQSLGAGAHFIKQGDPQDMAHDQGWVTSVCYSPHMESHIGLGFVKSGDKRLGETLIAVDFMREHQVEVKIVSSHFVDPEGERLRG